MNSTGGPLAAAARVVTGAAPRIVAAVILAASTLLAGPAGGLAPLRAAMPALILVTTTTYEVLPDEGRVAVTVEISATNRLRDTVTRRYFYDEAVLAVLPGTSNFRLTAASGSPSVTVRSADETGVVLRLRFGARLAAGKSTDLVLTFDLVDPGGAPDRPLRITPSLVGFQAWAHGTEATPGSSVVVRIPGGYSVEIGRGPLVGPATDPDGWRVYRSGPLDAPTTFVADIAADRAGGYLDARRHVSVGGQTVTLVYRAWPDDSAWRARVDGLFAPAIVFLADAIGAPWPFSDPLIVEEKLVRGSGGFAGTFDPATPLVQVGHAAAAGVILHEAAHGWFNGRLVADRWIAEGFASYYAELAAADLEVAIDAPDLANAPAEAAQPLNAWPPAGTASRAEDAYGYAASLALAREIAATVGDDILRETWIAAAGGLHAYQPVSHGVGAAVEQGAGPPDWRALLDLLADRVARTDPTEGADPATTTNAARASDVPIDAELERLWRRWVTRPEDTILLDARRGARAAYAGVVGAAAPWMLPRAIRDAMRAWEFEAALRGIGDAESVLRQRDALRTAADAAGLRLPDAVRVAFEGDAGLDVAAAEAATELAVIARLQEVAGMRIVEPGLIDWIGLLGADPEASLGAARAAFESGDLDGAITLAAAAETTWRSVPDVARGRITGAALLALATVLLAWLVRDRLRGRGRARRAVRHARPR